MKAEDLKRFMQKHPLPLRFHPMHKVWKEAQEEEEDQDDNKAET